MTNGRYEGRVGNDNVNPIIENIEIIDKDENGYTVRCKVTDNIGIDIVRFPTWTEKDNQDDLIWGIGIKSGDTYSYRVNISDHNNEQGVYHTHIYAHDVSGNITSDQNNSVILEEQIIWEIIKSKEIPLGEKTTKPMVTTLPVTTTADPIVTTTEPKVTTTAEPIVTTTEPEVTTTAESVVTTMPVTTKEPIVKKTLMYGDLNRDSILTNTDLVTLGQFLIGDIDYSSFDFESADVTGDGKVDIADFALLKQYFLGDYVALGK